MGVNPRDVLHNDKHFYKRRNFVCQMQTHVHNNFLLWLGKLLVFIYIIVINYKINKMNNYLFIFILSNKRLCNRHSPEPGV